MTDEASPSNCTYCYSLQCSLRIASSSSASKQSAVAAKSATLTLGRNLSREILLQVELQSGRSGCHPAVASYSLADCIVHQQGVAHGRGCIEIPSKHLTFQLNNCPPRQINVFLKSLQAKLDIMKAERDPKNNLRTPIAVARLQLAQGLPKVFNVLSPLSIGEIRKVRRMRGVATGESPLAKGMKSPRTPATGATKRPLRDVQATTPISTKSAVARRGLLLPPKQPKVDRVELTEEQKRVVRAVVKGNRNVFFTGSAGTGKSLVLQRIIEMLPASTTYVTAATGVAACQLGGVTLHSFCGIGVGGVPLEQSLKIAMSKKNVVKQWKLCTHLIIDEISMVDADYFDAIEYVARCIRCDDRPFGGIQLIITGDFLQLPPVVKGNEEPKFCFEGSAWGRVVQETIVLNDVKRQEDQVFVKILQSIRLGKCDLAATQKLRETKNTNFDLAGIVPTRLCTHTSDADQINRNCLNQLEGEEQVFDAQDSQLIQEYGASIAPKTIILKIGAQVMLNKNLDLARGLSNGSRGVVSSFSKFGFPVVKFLVTKEELEIRPASFSVRVPGCEEPAVRKQVPLQLAWAISIHKSQGLTLDAIEISLARVFAEGQSYVALSRARSLASIRVLGFDPCLIKASQKVIRYYESLEENNEEEDDGLNGFVIRKRSRLSL